MNINPLSRSNRSRASRAREYLRLHAVDVRCGDERLAKRELKADPAPLIVEFVADLLHLCDVEELDFATLEEYARAKYRADLCE